MASGTIYGSTDNRYIESAIDYTTSMDIACNRTLVTAGLSYRRTNSGYTTKGNGNFSITIDGNTSSTQTYATITENGWTKVMEHATWVYHNDDGQKWIEIGGSGGIPNSSFQVTAIGSGLTLEQIPRVSYPSVEPSTLDAGSVLTIHTNRKSSSFSHHIYCTYYNRVVEIHDGWDGDIAWRVPTDFVNEIPNDNGSWGTIWCETKYNGSRIGDVQTARFDVTVPASLVPTFESVTDSRVDGTVPSSWGVYVKGKSKAKFTFTGASGTGSAGIQSYTVNGIGSSASNIVTSDFLPTVGTNEFNAYVTDTRRRNSAAKSVSIEVLDYSVPFLHSFTALRCDAAGNPMEEGSSMKLSCTFDMAPVGNHNVVNGTFYYRKKGLTAWGQAGTFQKNANSPAGSLYTSTMVINNISLDYSYECRVVITDSLGESAEKTFLLQTPEVTIDFKKGGRGIGIGKVAEKENALEIMDSWELYYKGKKLVDFIYPVGSIYTSVVNTNPANLFGGTWESWGAGRVAFGVDTGQDEFNAVEKTGGWKEHRHELPLGANDGNNLSLMPWNYTADWGGWDRSPNRYEMGGSANPNAYDFRRMKTFSSGHLPPYITCYMWKRTA